MPAFGKLEEHPLVAQCVVYCAAKGWEQTTTPGSFVLQAVFEYDGDFNSLNDAQRKLIAGCR